MASKSNKQIRNFVYLSAIVLLLGACGGLVNHQVEKGETLYAIGWRYGQDYRDIAKWNQLNPPYVIKEGQWLRVAPPVDPWWQDDYPDRVAKADPGNRVVKPARAKTAQPSAPVKSISRLQKPPSPVPNVKVDDWGWPIKPVNRKAVNNNHGHKKGINITGKVNQPIYAAASGKVVYRGSGLVGYGKIIIIKHNKTFLSAYAHSAELLVKEGDKVKRGQPIARMGRTDAGEVLLYFEIRKNGKPVNPLWYLPKLNAG